MLQGQKNTITEDEWLVEQGERGHGFSIAVFPTQEGAQGFIDKFTGLLGADWAHTIQGRELLAIRRATR